MARNLGTTFWEKIVNKFNGRSLTQKDFNYCDRLYDKCNSETDKNILAEFITFIENDEQKEKYFEKAMTDAILKNYHS